MGSSAAKSAQLFLAGDVMTGRGVDQISPHQSKRELREDYVKDAMTYVALAEGKHGPVPAPVEPSYVWGDGLAVLARMKPHASIVNLETSVTLSDAFWPDKGVHYRMHPQNLACIRAAHIDVCTLANNHVMDFGVSGLLETLASLRAAGLQQAGAGENLAQARLPARVALANGVPLSVFAFGTMSSGIPPAWAADSEHPGVNLLPEISVDSAERVADYVHAHCTPAGLALVSIHWGSNWGYEIPAEQVAFAHRLIERGVDVVHGHSSHHVRAIELYRDKLVMYGCGDLINDYEGFDGHQGFRGELGAMYFATLREDGVLLGLRIVPMQMKRLRLTHAARSDAMWLTTTLNRLGREFGAHFVLDDDASIVLDKTNSAHKSNGKSAG